MTLFNNDLCVRCKGRGFCGKPCKIYSKIKNFIPKTKTHFVGDSPPEIFVGRYNYPNINAGILSADSPGRTEEFSMPEIWHKNKFPINQILSNRGKLIYGKFKTGIKKSSILLNVMQEVSMAYDSVSTEFFLKKAPKQNLELNKYTPVIANPAPLKEARLQENPKIKPKVDYLVSDSDCKAADSMKELYNSNIPISNINKILSAGLLGLKTQRKLVPTRWSITATDDTLSKSLLKRIKYYPEINDILLFHGHYNGNHYEILLLPDKFAFEVLEAELGGGLWNQGDNVAITQDYESFNGRKSYASQVIGAYYANRLALCEYLEKIKRQSTALFLREIRPEYYAPLGVGILRETCRGAFLREPEKFVSIDDAFVRIQERLRLPVQVFRDRSFILKEYGRQKRLSYWLS
jgi:hypothetical protein